MERKRSYIRFGTVLFKAETQRRRKKEKHDQLWKWRMSAAFVGVLGLCCGIGGQWQCATHNLKLTSGIQRQWESHFKQPSSHLEVKSHLWASRCQPFAMMFSEFQDCNLTFLMPPPTPFAFIWEACYDLTYTFHACMQNKVFKSRQLKSQHSAVEQFCVWREVRLGKLLILEEGTDYTLLQSFWLWFILCCFDSFHL